jgi:quercetin dioxygenase-like cupin family protein
MNRSARNRVVVRVMFAALIVVGAALATPSSGVIGGPVLARASFVDPVDLKFKISGHEAGREIVQVQKARETVVQQIVIGPGGNTGWHTHPGPAVVMIKQGELTVYSSEDPHCEGQTYRAGEAFVDPGQGHIHLARNLSMTENTEVWVTYFDVPIGGAFRIDAPDPATCH